MSKIQSLIKPTTPFQKWEANVYTDAILTLIDKYVDKHGDIALSCGSEWMFQDDMGQVDAMNLVGDILDVLHGFAEDENRSIENNSTK